MKTHLVFGALLGAALALVGPLAGEGRGDFTLHGNEQLTVDTYLGYGTLYDQSRARIVSGGFVDGLSAFDASVVDICGGGVSGLYAYQASAVHFSSGVVDHLTPQGGCVVDISGGSLTDLTAYDASVVHFSGGSVSWLCAWGASAVQLSGGTMNYLIARESSVVDISGGSVSNLCPQGGSVVDISGGSVSDLDVRDASVATFWGLDFHLGEGLYLEGDRVLGMGVLSGEWFDGTPWAVNISTNESGATILVIPEPATVVLLALGGLALLHRRGAAFVPGPNS